MTDLADLERRVTALEASQGENTKTLNWLVGTTGRIAGDLAAFKGEAAKNFDLIKADLTGLRRDLPSIVAEAVREGMKER